MEKTITLTLEFDESDEFVNESLMNAALFLNGIDYGFVFDCYFAKVTVSGLPSAYEDFLKSKIIEREVKINE